MRRSRSRQVPGQLLSKWLLGDCVYISCLSWQLHCLVRLYLGLLRLRWSLRLRLWTGSRASRHQP